MSVFLAYVRETVPDSFVCMDAFLEQRLNLLGLGLINESVIDEAIHKPGGPKV